MRLCPNRMESAGKPLWNGLAVCNSKNIINKLVLTVFHNILLGRRPSTTCNQKDHQSYQEPSHHESEPLIALRLRTVISRCCSIIHGALLSLFVGSRPPVLLKRGQPLALCGRQGIHPIARQCHKGGCQAVPVDGLAMLALDFPRLT